jgi:acyl carrier protein
MSAARDQLFDIIATLLEVPPASVTPQSTRLSLAAWDSLNHLNICVAVGQEFGVTLSAGEIERIDGVAALIAILQGKGIAIE